MTITELNENAEPLRVLMICTANQCRSPLAEVIAQSAFTARGVDAVVVSAGVMKGGQPAAKGSRKVAKELGLDLTQHVSHEVDAATVSAADMVITMGANHVLELGTRFPACIDKTVTLRELVEWVETDSPAGRLSRAQVIEQVRMAADRPLSALLVGGLDIDDPIGMPTSRFRRTGAEITELVETVLDIWYPPSAPS